MFVSALSVGLFWPEIVHRELLWSTPRAMMLRTSAAKLIAVGTFATLLIILTSVTALFNPFNREVFIPTAGLYVPLYFALMWIQAVVWAAVSALFLFYATISRWATVAIVTAIAILWSMAGQFFPQVLGPSLKLPYKSCLSWNFLGPFAPLGMVPLILPLQALGLFGLVLVFFTEGMLVRRRFSEWQEVRLPAIWAVLRLGIVVLLGAGARVINKIQF